MSSGMMAGINASLFMKNIDEKFVLPTSTLTGALSHYISDINVKHFQPMSANFGIVDQLDRRIRKKEERYHEIALKALDIVDIKKEYLKSFIK